jgi:mannose-1-phosphate guanylyltransferase
MQTGNVRIWAVILAGGEGERLRPLMQQWLGRHVPKQYCTFLGTRSMLNHTLDRAVRLARPDRVVTVMARSHASLPLPQHPALSRGRVVLQPHNRETAPGVFLALTYIAAVDPDASVVLFPSDHFIQPSARFIPQVHEALWAAAALDRVMLVGVRPQGLDLNYGWIQPGRALEHGGVRCRARAIERFVENPTQPVARAIRRSGALLNTMVVAGSLRRLWGLGRAHLPALIDRFELLGATLGTSQEAAMLDDIYADMPRHNFSVHVLERCVRALGVLELEGVTWSDWGTADRIAATIQNLGRRPAFADVNTWQRSACHTRTDRVDGAA